MILLYRFSRTFVYCQIQVFLTAGNGYADLVYLPKKTSPLPALVIELKWNQSAAGAIDQIRKKKYPAALKGYGGEILLVGIGYEKAVGEGQRKHTCRIEKIQTSPTPACAPSFRNETPDMPVHI